jgi:hemolysin activation/secretion protein
MTGFGFFKNSNSFVMIVSAILMLSVMKSAHAAEVNNPTEQQLRDNESQNRERQREALRLRAPLGENEIPEAGQKVFQDNGVCFPIDKVEIEIIKLLQADEVASITDKIEGRCIVIKQLDDLIQNITNAYIQKGFITARSYIPAQDLSTRTLRIVMVEGELEGFEWNSVAISDSKEGRTQIGASFPGAVGEPLNLRDIEQSVENLSRLSSFDVSTKLKPGKKLGGTILEINNSPKSFVHGDVYYNNLGFESTGKHVSGFRLNFDSSLDRADTLYINYKQTGNYVGLPSSSRIPSSKTISYHASIPFRYWLYSLNGSFFNYRSEFESVTGSLNETKGLSNSIQLKAEKTLFRDQTRKTKASFALSRSKTENFLSIGQISDIRLDNQSHTLTAAHIDFSYTHTSRLGIFSSIIGYEQGLGFFDSINADSVDLNGDARYKKISLDLALHSSFELLNRTINSSTSLTIQHSDDHLLGSQQISLGGTSTVRGTPSGLMSGNSGYYVRNEFSAVYDTFDNKTIKKVLGHMQPYVAIDYGEVKNKAKYDINHGRLLGGAIGVRNLNGQVSYDLGYEKVFDRSLQSKEDSRAFTNDGRLYFKVSSSF